MTRQPDSRPTRDADVDRLADEAERGYDVEQILTRRRGGRPPRGAAAGTVESVRLEPDLKRDVLRGTRPQQRLRRNPPGDR